MNFTTITFGEFEATNFCDTKFKWWSRCYEYPWVLRTLKDVDAKLVHNTCAGFAPLHRSFVTDLEETGVEVVNSDNRKVSLPNASRFDVTDLPPMAWRGRFDAVVNISSLEEIQRREQILGFQAMLAMCKVGGYVVATFDLPGLAVNRFEMMLGAPLKRADKPLRGDTSMMPNTRYKNLTCGALLVRRDD